MISRNVQPVKKLSNKTIGEVRFGVGHDYVFRHAVGRTFVFHSLVYLNLLMPHIHVIMAMLLLIASTCSITTTTTTTSSIRCSSYSSITCIGAVDTVHVLQVNHKTSVIKPGLHLLTSYNKKHPCFINCHLLRNTYLNSCLNDNVSDKLLHFNKLVKFDCF